MDVSPITSQLYVAAQLRAEDLDAVLQLDPGLIISMILERRPSPALSAAGLSVLWLRTVDFPLIPIPLRTLKRGVEAALPLIHKGGRVLVFCKGGRHRSVAMACCILIGMGYRSGEAMELVDRQRVAADPRARHIRRQVERFEVYWGRSRGQGLSSP